MILNYINWDIDPEIVNIWGFSIRYYGLLFAIGLILSISVLKRIFKQENIAGENLELLIIYGILGIFIGARLGHCLFYQPDYFLQHPLEIILPVRFLEDGSFKIIGFQGLASHGGALGLIIALIIYARKTKQSVLKTVDLIAIVTPLAAVFIRLANLVNSEIIGKATQLPWAFIFRRVDNVPRHPAQLYEAVSYLIIFLIMITLYKTKRNKLHNGFYFGLVLTFIFTARFFIEFLKEHQVAFENNLLLDMGQLLSIPYIIVGVVFMAYSFKKK